MTAVDHEDERARPAGRTPPLGFGSRQELECEPLAASQIAAGLRRMLDRAVGERIRLEIEDESHGALVLGDRGQLERVLLDLVSHACDAMPDGGRLGIRTAVTPRSTVETGPGTVTITVSDSGIGMTEEARRRIFDPLYEQSADRNPAGLATVFGIVQQLDGTITIPPQGQGNAFVVELPELAGAPATARKRPPAAAGAESDILGVLLVEDDNQIRVLLALLLGDAGHRVLSAASGEEALAIMRDCPQAVDLLLTDMMLPDIPGGEIARRALALRPDLHVIYTSGYPEDATARGGDGFLPKPFTDCELADAISRASRPHRA